MSNEDVFSTDGDENLAERAKYFKNITKFCNILVRMIDKLLIIL